MDQWAPTGLKRTLRRASEDASRCLLSKLKSFAPDQNLLVFSDPRGGSTWLTELLSHVPETAVLWEPLHLGHQTPFRQLGFGWRQHIPLDAEWPEAERAFLALFRGKITNRWLYSREKVQRFLYARRMIVKFCRGNALLPWLTHKFNFRYRPVLLLRHPFAIAASQFTHGAWNHPFDKYEIPECRYNEIYLDHHEFLGSLRNRAEASVATWCITNRVPLHLHGQPNDKKWMTVYYEDLLMYPQTELGRIFDAWQMDMPEGLLACVGKASSTTRIGSWNQGVEGQLSKWREVFDSQQINRLLSILEYFGIQKYDSRELPVHRYQ